MDVLALLHVVVLESGHDTEGVGTEVVALGLDEVGGEGVSAVAVKEREGGGERRDGDTPEGRLGDDAAPSGLGLGNGLEEEGGDEEVLEVGVLAVGGSDVREEDGLGTSAKLLIRSSRAGPHSP